jgi:hypothetical protein
MKYLIPKDRKLIKDIDVKVLKGKTTESGILCILEPLLRREGEYAEITNTINSGISKKEYNFIPYDIVRFYKAMHNLSQKFPWIKNYYEFGAGAGLKMALVEKVFEWEAFGCEYDQLFLHVDYHMPTKLKIGNTAGDMTRKWNIDEAVKKDLVYSYMPLKESRHMAPFVVDFLIHIQTPTIWYESLAPYIKIVHNVGSARSPFIQIDAKTVTIYFNNGSSKTYDKLNFIKDCISYRRSK